MNTTCERQTGASKPKVLLLGMTELNEIMARLRAAGIPEEDISKLEALSETLAWLQGELEAKRLTVARLRSLFGIKSSEKSKDLLGGNKGNKGGNEDDAAGGGAADADADDADADAADGADGADDDVDTDPEEPSGDENKRKKKRKGHGRNGASDYTGAEHVCIHHGTLESGDQCPECEKGRVYTMSKPRTLVRVVGQAPLHATVYEQERLRCNLCLTIFYAEMPAGIGNQKYDATAAAMIILLKYGSGMPFNRLHRLEGSLGIPMPVTTQWQIVEEAAENLTAVHDELIRQAAQGQLVHNDDTSMRVIGIRKQIEAEQRTAGEAGEAKGGRTGIFLTSIISELEGGHRVALFFTGRNHAGENIADVLAQRAAELSPPIQMCDALEHNAPKDFETEIANCLVHGRRKFVEVLDSFPDESRHVIEVLRDVYRHEAFTRERGMSADERLRYHQEHSKPLMDGLKEWMDLQFQEKRIEPNSTLGGAIRYMTKRWGRFTLFLRKAGVPLDNNIAERALKKAILHRKNSLFYRTEHGALVGDVFMSLIHTAELAGVNVFEYLVALIRHAKKASREPARWMPWNYTEPLAECADA